MPAVCGRGGLECCRCGHRLLGGDESSLTASLALALASLLLLVPTTVFPVLTLTTFGARHLDWLSTGPRELWGDGFALLAGIVFLFSLAIPYVQLTLLIWVLYACRSGQTEGLGRAFRWAVELRPWVMVEVYVVGCCVAYSRLQSVGTIGIGDGGWCLLGCAACIVLLTFSLDERRVWERILPERPIEAEQTPISCEVCELILPAHFEHRPCPRCTDEVHFRKTNSIQRTWALIAAGALLYLPANVLPVLYIERFGKAEPNTILSGVRELIRAGLWPLAIIVFAASIAVPLFKLLGLALMLVLTHRRSRLWLIGRTRLYRVIDFIGRWSSIDLFMISILVALVRFGALTSVRAQDGAVAFAAVVLTTMFASRGFDSRLMWDAVQGRTHE